MLLGRDDGFVDGVTLCFDEGIRLGFMLESDDGSIDGILLLSLLDSINDDLLDGVLLRFDDGPNEDSVLSLNDGLDDGTVLGCDKGSLYYIIGNIGCNWCE